MDTLTGGRETLRRILVPLELRRATTREHSLSLFWRQAEVVSDARRRSRRARGCRLQKGAHDGLAVWHHGAMLLVGCPGPITIRSWRNWRPCCALARISIWSPTLHTISRLVFAHWRPSSEILPTRKRRAWRAVSTNISFLTPTNQLQRASIPGENRAKVKAADVEDF
jgi:hypothetical protein